MADNSTIEHKLIFRVIVEANWTIPMFYSGAAEALSGKTAAPISFVSCILVAIVSVLSLVITSAW
jgi:hypothetical protein